MKFAVRVLGVLVLAVALASSGVHGEEDRRSNGDLHRLKMEELEVRGMRGTPGVLHMPVAEEIFFLSPVRFDLIREDLIRPVLPWEVNAEPLPQQGISEEVQSHRQGTHR
jgi:hypothetical protein